MMQRIFANTSRRGNTPRNHTPSVAFPKDTSRRGNILRNHTPSVAFPKDTSRRGNIIFFLVFGLFFIFGLLSLVIDTGWMMFQYNRLQTATDAAWKAGTNEMARQTCQNLTDLTSDQQNAIKKRIQDAFLANGYSPEEAAKVVTTIHTIGSHSRQIEVFASVHVGLFFARMIDVPFTQVSTRKGSLSLSSVNASESGAISGIDPWLIPQGIPHGLLSSNGSSPVSLKIFGRQEGFQPGDVTMLRIPSGTALLIAGQNQPFVPTTRLSLDLNAKNPEQVNFTWAAGLPKHLDTQTPIKIASDPEDLLVLQGLQERFSANPIDSRVIVSLLQSQNSSDSSAVFQLTSSDMAIISGFAEFELLPPASTTPGEVRGRFIRYISHPDLLP